MTEFNNIGLVARMGNDSVVESLRRVRHFLQSHNKNVLLEDTAKDLLKDSSATGYKQAEMGDKCDLVIAVGGDGNILGAARTFAAFGVPILGINRGRLGFLADVSPTAIEKSVGDVLEGNFATEEHFLLEGEVSVEGQKALPCALNEVLISTAKSSRMLEFNLYIDDIFVYKQYSDGLIISSPTGSTAYALSAGGPIMHPSLDAIVLVPMFPHQLNSRPLVVPGDSEIKIVIGSHMGMNAMISFDSQLEFEIAPGESICVKKKAARLKLVHPPGHSFYEVCRSKLDWASRLGA
ncbi:MAG: NAD(+) kinase [Pseudomonadales bacterium]|nr:NAD(+) kinase [Pseudomonadales bacterium]